MKIEFLDGTQLEVIAIYGGPKLIHGVMRDTLRIEVDPGTIPFEDLKSMFKDNPNTGTLYSCSDAPDENGDIVSTKAEIGEGYKIFVSISDEVRNINQVPGKLAPVETEEVYIVTIAQQTYQEYLLESSQSSG